MADHARGFIGSAIEVGVPGAEGTGDPMAAPGTLSKLARTERCPMSGGAGLFDETPGRQVGLDMAGQLGRLVVMGIQCILSVLRPKRIDVHGTVRTTGSR